MSTTTQAISQEALDQIFLKARTHNGWRQEQVSDEILKKIYDVAKWGPTSANISPLRVVFIKSKAAKEKLLQAVSPGNHEKTMSAPVTAILAEDREFYEKLPKLFPHADARSWFVGNQPMIDTSAFRNSSLQGAYFIIAARAVGLDTGPMSGFDNAKLDELFFKGTSFKSNFLCNLGYGDASKLYPRSPRFEFEEACQIL
jgi:3-hydroxypropanoate dehydrogenase